MMKGLQMALDSMRRERAELAQRLDIVDKAIADMERTVATLNPEGVKATSERKEFSGMTLRNAATVVLKRADKPMPTRQLCDLLKAGGFHTTAEDFYMVVYGGLKGMENFARTKEGWWVLQEGAKAGAQVEEPKVVAKKPTALVAGRKPLGRA